MFITYLADKILCTRVYRYLFMHDQKTKIRMDRISNVTDIWPPDIRPMPTARVTISGKTLNTVSKINRILYLRQKQGSGKNGYPVHSVEIENY